MIATSNTMIAKIFAALAVAGLVVSSVAAFAPTAGAQTTTTTTTTTSASVTFARDLTIGSTGADVTALQNWLISKGHAIAAGATGYFGAQTQAALAAYQAANGISPAAGYFGPITRAKVNAGGSTSGGTGSGTGTGSTGGDLSGGEADLSDFEFNREESSGAEGEEEVEVATIEFDVEDGDVRVERLELMASSTMSGDESNPWDYFDHVYLMAGGEEIADMDVSDRDAWDEEDGDGEDIHRLVINGLDYVVEEDDRAEITIAFDISDSIDDGDLTQEFDFYVPEDGVRAVDGEGIQSYIPGSADSDEVTFGFDAEETGDLDLSTSSEDPDSATLVADEDNESEDYTVFVFNIENNDDIDSLVTDITIDVATSSGDDINDILESATLSVDGDDYDGDINNDGTIDFEDIDFIVGGDETVEVTIMVTLAEDADGATVQFSLDAADVTAESDETGEDSVVGGSADGETHTVSLSGVLARDGEATSSTQVLNTTTGAEEGTYEITFEVEAIEEDVYIYKGADIASSTTSGVVYTIYQDGTASTTLVSSSQASDNLEANDSDNGDTSDYFIVRAGAGNSRSFTLSVSINPVTTGFYKVELESVRFDETEDNSAEDDQTYSVPDNAEFESSAEQLNG